MEKLVFIGSSSEELVDDSFKKLASQLACILAKEGYDFVFGASSLGMMGSCYCEFVKEKRKIYSYTVDKYKDLLVDLDSYYDEILETTFERSLAIYKKADILIFLPGGIGTLAEIFSFLEENRSIAEPKKMIILNYNGFYDELLKLIQNLITNHFSDESIWNYFDICDSVSDVINVINNFDKIKKN